MDFLKKLTTILMAAMLAASLCVACADDDDDDDDNDDSTTITCSDFTTQDECEANDECMWEFPDDATDASVYANATSDVSDDDDDDDDAGECVAVDEEDDDDDDDDLSALCSDACDDIISCGYSDDATTCVDDCETGALDLMGGTVAEDIDILTDFSACMIDASDTCTEYGDVWFCVEEVCCVDEDTIAACGLVSDDCVVE